MEDVDLPEGILSVPQHLLQELKIHSDENDLSDFCEIKRKSCVTTRRKSRRSMNFTPERVMMLASAETGLDAGSDCEQSEQQTYEREEPQVESMPDQSVLGESSLNNKILQALDSVTLGEHQSSVQSKKHKRRRRSADFDIVHSIQASLSPDIEMEGLDELQKLPGSRKSRRLKRQSIELCRSVMLPLPPECDSPVSESPTTSLPNSPLINLTELPENTPPHQCLISPLQDRPAQPDSMESPLPITDSQQEVSDTEPKTGSGKAKKGKEAVKQKGGQRGRRKRKSEEPALEDIYRNRLWRTQMPKEGLWETIYESPRQGKRGQVEVCSAKRFRRVLSYDDFFNKVKLKRRRQKAKALGFKPMTAKKKVAVGAALDLRIQDLDCFLETQEGAGASQNRDQYMDSNLQTPPCFRVSGIGHQHLNSYLQAQPTTASSQSGGQCLDSQSLTPPSTGSSQSTEQHVDSHSEERMGMAQGDTQAEHINKSRCCDQEANNNVSAGITGLSIAEPTSHTQITGPVSQYKDTPMSTDILHTEECETEASELWSTEQSMLHQSYTLPLQTL